ncbi:MAG TPA: hypothetical protein VMV29_11295 [Ktedonobacterales bacterium]|nr:hypothetical protein [Ktedonobacterales bacterium]
MTASTTTAPPNPLTQPPASYRFEGTMTALTSITHFGESVGGTEQVLRREKVALPDGDYADVPIISGNSWRGQLRDCGMRAMLDELARALGRDTITLSPQAFYLLFSGGSLTKDAGRGVDIGQARNLRALVPLLGVFGGAVGRQIMEGKLAVGKIIPVCAETRHLLPDALVDHPHAVISVYERTSMEHYTRMDDAKRESLAGRYLPVPDQVLLEAPSVRKVTNKRTGEVEEIADKPGAAQQMRYGFETITAGTVFSCGLSLRSVTPLEFEAFLMALAEWSREPVIGGRSGSGMGRVRLAFPGWVEANPLLRREADATSVGAPFGALYREHLARNGGAIVQALEAIG